MKQEGPDSPVSFRPVRSEDELRLLARMAAEIWREYWPAIIGAEQTEYMVASFQSLEAMRASMAEEAYEYWLIEDASQPEGSRIVGYTGGHDEAESGRFFISKIYLYDWARGRHYASRTIAFYEALCAERGFHAMYLTVNKRNELGIRAYEGKGFEVVESVETDIGSGFIMDDYVMEKHLR